MKAGAALSNWLADREAQRRSQRAIRAFSEQWARHPLKRRLESDLEQVSETDAPAILGAAARFMDVAAEIESLLGEMIGQARADPFFRPPFVGVTSEINTALLLYHSRKLSITLGVSPVDMLAAKKAVRHGPTSIAFIGLMSSYRFVKSGGATLSFWEAPPIDENFVGAQAGQCRPTGRRRIADGEEIVLDGRHQSFLFEHAESDIVFFQAIAHSGGAPLAVEYDRDTLGFLGATSTDEASSRIQLMASALTAMDREDAVPLLGELLKSAHFFARWHIMREMLALDAEAALPVLRELAEHDPHPDIRGAARQTLEAFFADEPVPAPAPAPEGEARCRA